MNEIEEIVVVIYIITVGLMVIVAAIGLIGLGIQKLRGKRPYDGRFRTGGCL